MADSRGDALSLLAVTTLALASGGCAGSSDPTLAASPATDTVLVSDTVVVDHAAVIRELEQRVSLLQLQLLERDAHVAELERTLNETRQEVVRVMARMQTLASRAEAASAMAEAEIAVNALHASRPDAVYLEQARTLLSQASEQFDGGNWGGSLYLSGQARRLVRSGEGGFIDQDAAALRPDETRFQMPVPVRTLRRSNVREGPGLEHAVLTVLDPDAPLTGLSYTSEWMRVRLGDGQIGWIFYSLVGARP